MDNINDCIIRLSQISHAYNINPTVPLDPEHPMLVSKIKKLLIDPCEQSILDCQCKQIYIINITKGTPLIKGKKGNPDIPATPDQYFIKKGKIVDCETKCADDQFCIEYQQGINTKQVCRPYEKLYASEFEISDEVIFNISGENDLKGIIIKVNAKTDDGETIIFSYSIHNLEKNIIHENILEDYIALVQKHTFEDALLEIAINDEYNLEFKGTIVGFEYKGSYYFGEIISKSNFKTLSDISNFCIRYTPNLTEGPKIIGISNYLQTSKFYIGNRVFCQIIRAGNPTDNKKGTIQNIKSFSSSGFKYSVLLDADSDSPPDAADVIEICKEENLKIILRIGMIIQYTIDVTNVFLFILDNLPPEEHMRREYIYGNYVGKILNIENNKITINHLNGGIMIVDRSLLNNSIKPISNSPTIIFKAPITPLGFKMGTFSDIPFGILSDFIKQQPDGTITIDGTSIPNYSTFNNYTRQIDLTFNYYMDSNELLYILDPESNYYVLLSIGVNKLIKLKLDKSYEFIIVPIQPFNYEDVIINETPAGILSDIIELKEDGSYKIKATGNSYNQLMLYPKIKIDSTWLQSPYYKGDNNFIYIKHKNYFYRFIISINMQTGQILHSNSIKIDTDGTVSVIYILIN